jgi:hypothetical protein
MPRPSIDLSTMGYGSVTPHEDSSGNKYFWHNVWFANPINYYSRFTSSQGSVAASSPWIFSGAMAMDPSLDVLGAWQFSAAPSGDMASIDAWHENEHGHYDLDHANAWGWHEYDQGNMPVIPPGANWYWGMIQRFPMDGSDQIPQGYGASYNIDNEAQYPFIEDVDDYNSDYWGFSPTDMGGFDAEYGYSALTFRINQGPEAFSYRPDSGEPIITYTAWNRNEDIPESDNIPLNLSIYGLEESFPGVDVNTGNSPDDWKFGNLLLPTLQTSLQEWVSNVGATHEIADYDDAMKIGIQKGQLFKFWTGTGVIDETAGLSGDSRDYSFIPWHTKPLSFQQASDAGNSYIQHVPAVYPAPWFKGDQRGIFTGNFELSETGTVSNPPSSMFFRYGPSSLGHHEDDTWEFLGEYSRLQAIEQAPSNTTLMGGEPYDEPFLGYLYGDSDYGIVDIKKNIELSWSYPTHLVTKYINSKFTYATDREVGVGGPYEYQGGQNTANDMQDALSHGRYVTKSYPRAKDNFVCKANKASVYSSGAWSYNKAGYEATALYDIAGVAGWISSKYPLGSSKDRWGYTNFYDAQQDLLSMKTTNPGEFLNMVMNLDGTKGGSDNDGVPHSFSTTNEDGTTGFHFVDRVSSTAQAPMTGWTGLRNNSDNNVSRLDWTDVERFRKNTRFPNNLSPDYLWKRWSYDSLEGPGSAVAFSPFKTFDTQTWSQNFTHHDFYQNGGFFHWFSDGEFAFESTGGARLEEINMAVPDSADLNGYNYSNYRVNLQHQFVVFQLDFDDMDILIGNSDNNWNADTKRKILRNNAIKRFVTLPHWHNASLLDECFPYIYGEGTDLLPANVDKDRIKHFLMSYPHDIDIEIRAKIGYACHHKSIHHEGFITDYWNETWCRHNGSGFNSNYLTNIHSHAPSYPDIAPNGTYKMYGDTVKAITCSFPTLQDIDGHWHDNNGSSPMFDDISIPHSTFVGVFNRNADDDNNANKDFPFLHINEAFTADMLNAPNVDDLDIATEVEPKMEEVVFRFDGSKLYGEATLFELICARLLIGPSERPGMGDCFFDTGNSEMNADGSGHLHAAPFSRLGTDGTDTLIGDGGTLMVMFNVPFVKGAAIGNCEVNGNGDERPSIGTPADGSSALFQGFNHHTQFWDEDKDYGRGTFVLNTFDIDEVGVAYNELNQSAFHPNAQTERAFSSQGEWFIKDVKLVVSSGRKSASQGGI